MAAGTRTTGALDLVVYGVAASLAALAVAVFRITEILSPEGPAVTVGADAASAALGLSVGTTVDTVSVRAPDLGVGGRSWMIATVLLVAVASVVVAAALMRVALAVRRGRVFAGGATRALAVIAGTLTAAVFAWPIVDGMGRQHAMQSLGIRFETLSMLDLLPLLPILLVAVAAAVLASAFAQGERLQRDTEGLV
ncbi:hypothetical protein Q9S78_03330 [Microbacterium sp. KSW-18]|uniref:DUF2975 domain-containing protein n=1 Tax=Microbacterium aquilitoris TaxID=3067307 RepID=A0ABU3GG61_9MICO|nr:hypothetical protein [Microbacterium sp. KSW-18]MDT3329694.1 hypothetical protein [Microbacterium sp. KSW-18]